jgi:hypothetical protein
MLKEDKEEKYDNEILDEAMDNAYLIMTGIYTFDELIGLRNEVVLPYNIHENEDGCDIDSLIQYYEEEENYERCSKLAILKDLNGTKKILV